MKKTIVSVVIPVLNEIKYLKECVDGLLHCGYPHSCLEVIIVDGGSDDGTDLLIAGYQRQFKFIKYLLNKNKTVPFAMNMGIKAAKGDYIVRMDAHAAFPYGYIDDLIKYMELLRADNVGGVLVTCPAVDKVEAKAVAMILSNSFGVGNSKFRVGSAEDFIKVDTVPFGCYRRDLFEKIGYFDEMLTRNQDDEFNARLISNGGVIYLIPSIVIRYYARATLAKMSRMLYQYGYFKPLVAKKIGRATTLRQLFPPLFVAVLFLTFVFESIFCKSIYLFIFIVLLHSSIGLAVSLKLNKHRVGLLNLLLIYGFMIGHISYGVGYMLGLFDFFVRKIHLRSSTNGISISR